MLSKKNAATDPGARSIVIGCLAAFAALAAAGGSPAFAQQA